MKAEEFIQRIKMAAASRTIYIKGCFGAPMTEANKKRYCNNLAYNRKRMALINACSADTFGFDCVCLIKGILWGWNGDAGKEYGGAVYKAKGIPDFGTEGTMALCSDVSSDFSNIIPGEILWMKGHVGVYVGDGKVIECTPSWSNNVQYSNMGNIGYKSGHYRIWTKHGRLKFIEYDESQEEKEEAENDPKLQNDYHVVAKNETLYGIGQAYGIPWEKIAEWNGIEKPWIILPGQRLKISRQEQKTDQELQSGYHIVAKNETLYGIGHSYGIPWEKIAALNGIEDPWIILPGQRIRIK